MITAWTGHKHTDFNSPPLFCAASPPICLRQDQGRCRYYAAEGTISLSEGCFILGWFFFQKKNHHISQQRPSFFSNLTLLEFSDHTVWGHEERSQEWFLEEAENPPGNTSLLLATSPEFPIGNRVRQAGGWMAWGLPPSLLSMFLEARPELMTVSSLQSCCSLHRGPLTGHSNSLRKEKFHIPIQERAKTQTSHSKEDAETANTNSFSTSIIRGFHQHLESFVL